MTLASKAINSGGENGHELLYNKRGYIETVTESNTYRLKKAVDLDYDLSPEYETVYDDDEGFDLTPSGNKGTWEIRLPVTSDMVSISDPIEDSVDDGDKQTISYWAYELDHGRFPLIRFRDSINDNRPADSKLHELNFLGVLTQCKLSREDSDGPRRLLLAGLIKRHIDFVKES